MYAYEHASAVTESTSGSPMMGSQSDTIVILHFNDVYNIEPREQEPVGGAARFRTAIKQRAHLNPIVMFSGDAFSPSLMSTVTKGKQMVPILNELGMQCACYGNHDFDFGVDSLVHKAGQCNFPWLISNVYDSETEEPLAEGKISHMIEWQGHKIGVIGLVEQEWIATLSTIDPDDVIFLDYVEEGKRLAVQLKEEGAEYVIALTHMRWPNDERLAQKVDEIDLILGGHDHDYNVKQINGKYVIKSGTDFQNMCQVMLKFVDDKVYVSTEEVIVDSSIEEDPQVKDIVSEYLDVFKDRMDKVIGSIETDLDGRFANIRSQETNLGNFITDMMLEGTDADCALLNSGTLRSDRIHPKGQFKMKDLLAILPMVDPLVVIKISGKQLLQALENGVSQYPKLEGRFPQVSGIKFGYDPDKPSGNRVEPRYVKVGDDFLDIRADYRLCTKHYLANGKDGYDVFKDCELLLNEEEGPRLSNIVHNHFKTVRIMKGEKKCRFSHHQSIISLNRRKSLVRQQTIAATESPSSGAMPFDSPRGSSPHHRRPPLQRETEIDQPNTPLSRSFTSPSPSNASFSSSARGHLERRQSIHNAEVENIQHAVAPEVEGRIFILTQEALAREEELLHSARVHENLQNTSITELDELQAAC